MTAIIRSYDPDATVNVLNSRLRQVAAAVPSTVFVTVGEVIDTSDNEGFLRHAWAAAMPRPLVTSCCGCLHVMWGARAVSCAPGAWRPLDCMGFDAGCRSRIRRPMQTASFAPPPPSLRRGHGTQVVEDRLMATVCGVVERINKLVYVKPLKARWVHLLPSLQAPATCARPPALPCSALPASPPHTQARRTLTHTQVQGRAG